MHELAAHTGCPDGPCPDLTRDEVRGKTGGQGYVPPADALGDHLPPTPEGEVRWEMGTDVFEGLLAQYLTDDAIARVLAMREANKASGRRGRSASTDLTPGDFDAVFAEFVASPSATGVFRWEALQRYEVASDEPSLIAFRDGSPRPERSVRTSPWLARIASSTVSGKSWRRVRHVVEPLTEYVRWELLAYVESQSAGEQITVHTTADTPEVPDFWLFDGDVADQRAVLMHYDAAGVPRRYELLEQDDPRYPELVKARDRVSAEAVPLNDYLARPKAGVHAA